MNRREHRIGVFLLLAVACLLARAAPATAIVLHPDGEPNLATWTDRPPADVIGRWSSYASCVAVSRNCVLTTRHQPGGIATNVQIDGIDYAISEIRDHNSADLRIVKLCGANLPDFVPIHDQSNEINKQTVLAGWGVGAGPQLETDGIIYGYEWAGFGSRSLRFGTNRIAGVVDDNHSERFTSDIITADFDGLSEGFSTSYEAIPAAHDSGGGCFIKNDGIWKLAGLIRAVESHYEQGHDDDPNYVLYESWFRDREDPNIKAPDYFDAVRISSYAQWIYDNLPPVAPGDLNGDDLVDAFDFAVFAQYWAATDCNGPNPCLGADSEPDGDVDALDLAEFALHWLAQ